MQFSDETKQDEIIDTSLSQYFSDGEEPFSSDDSVQDPNYANDSSSSSSESSHDTEVEMANSLNLPVQPDVTKKGREKEKQSHLNGKNSLLSA